MFGKDAPLDFQKEHIFLAEVVCCTSALSKYVLEIEKVIVSKVLQLSAFQGNFSCTGLFFDGLKLGPLVDRRLLHGRGIEGSAAVTICRFDVCLKGEYSFL